MSGFGGVGLTKVSTGELEELLRALHRGHLVFPIRASELIGNGFPHIAEKTDLLQGLDEKGLRAVLVAVIAERREQARREERIRREERASRSDQ